MNVTVSTELTRALLGLGIEDLNQKVAAAPAGSEGLTLLPYFNGERIIKINDYFRMSKYTKNGRFEIHKDGINTDKDGNRACMTLNIFLNIPEKGGGTIFYTDEKTLLKNVRPKKGRGTLFYNQIYHEGEVVEKGQKYLLRTDVMSNLLF
jgi:hypothetical protein